MMLCLEVFIVHIKYFTSCLYLECKNVNFLYFYRTFKFIKLYLLNTINFGTAQYNRNLSENCFIFAHRSFRFYFFVRYSF